MSDRELQNLVRMAAEIETLEREALLGPDLRLATAGNEGGRDSRFQINRWLSLGGITAAAAGLALAAFIALNANGPAAPTGPIATGPNRFSDLPTAAPTPSEFSKPLTAAPAGAGAFQAPFVQPASTDPSKKVTVFSLFKDSDGKCSCYQWHETDGKPLEDLARGELVDIALQAPCTSEAQRIIVIAINSKNLGATPQAMADQVASLPYHRDPAVAALAYPALFPNSTVITETISMERVKLPTAADLVRAQ